MEKDINLILDVEPDEAQALVNLIELLFEEWYVAKHVRAERLGKLGFVAENKDAKKAQVKPPRQSRIRLLRGRVGLEQISHPPECPPLVRRAPGCLRAR